MKVLVVIFNIINILHFTVKQELQLSQRDRATCYHWCWCHSIGHTRFPIGLSLRLCLTKFEVPSFTNSKDIIGAKLNENGSRDPDHANSGYSVIGRLELNIFGNIPPHTKFGDSRFNRSGDMITGVAIEMGHVTLTTPV